jgi:hypothetical protein
MISLLKTAVSSISTSDHRLIDVSAIVEVYLFYCIFEHEIGFGGDGGGIFIILEGVRKKI